MSAENSILGPILIPRAGGAVTFIHDGAMSWNARGLLTYVGPAEALAQPLVVSQKSKGILLPPFLDNHIHIPQHPIRGQFMKDVPANPEGGRLLAGLNQNVFPAEARCADDEQTKTIVQQFLDDTLANGVIGGAAYMTVHAEATRTALRMLPETWEVGLVMMNLNCPGYLRTDEAGFERDVRSLAEEFGPRFILTDRFAVVVDSPLRRSAVALAKELGLRMQTHLNEQEREKRFVEQVLYPETAGYTDVYRRDGLLDCHHPILAHCIHMRDAEWDMVRASSSVVAHCPTSNTLLGSGIMPLDAVIQRGIDYAICTDVGASPTTSILCEMAQFLKVHATRTGRATPAEALYRTTLAAADMLGVGPSVGRLEVGRPATFIEIDAAHDLSQSSPDDAILRGLLGTTRAELDAFSNRAACRESLDALSLHGLDIGPQLDGLADEISRTQRQLDHKVQRVTVGGKVLFSRS